MRLLLGALLCVFAVVTWIVMSVPADRNELGLMGELEINAAAGTQVYVGSRKCGSGTVTLTWNDLLGVAGQSAAAIPGTDIEQLVGAEAKIVWQKEGQTMTHRITQDINYRFDEVLFQRDDGSLDHVLAVTCEFLEGQGKWNSLMIPVRVRSANQKSIDYFPLFDNQRAGNFSRGMIPSRHDHAKFILKFDTRQGGWPSEIAMPTEPLWVPREES